MSDVDWSRLAGRIRGTLVLRTDSNFEAQVAGLVWNGLKPARAPGAIAQCLNEGDVRHCVLFARENGLKVSVRGGGHNWNGVSVRDGVLVLDLSQLNEVHIDAANQRASIQPVVTNKEMVAALGKEGLAYQVGTCPTVPASGYLLGGGLGLNTQEWGAGCHGVEAVDVVTAQGETVVADETHNTDLYWAARGGAQGFPGVVVRYHLKVHRRPRIIRQVTCLCPLDKSQQLADWLSKLTLDQPRTFFSNTMITSSPVAGLAEGVWDYLTGHVRSPDAKREAWLTYVGVAFAETEKEADEVLAPFRTPPPGSEGALWFFTKSSFPTLNTFVGLMFQKGRQFVADYHWVDISMSEVVKRVTPEFVKTRDAESFVLIASYQTPPSQMLPPGSTCFSMSSNNLVGIYGISDDPNEVGFNQAWVANMRGLLEPNSVGLYIGEADLEVSPNRAEKCYSPEAWAKLRKIKKKYDPENLFPWFLGADAP